MKVLFYTMINLIEIGECTMVKEKAPVPIKKKERSEVIDRSKYDFLNEMDRIVDQFRSSFNDLFYRANPWETATNTETRLMPPLSDIVDHGNKFEMNVELPGISKEDINVEVTPYNIKISANKGKKHENKGKNWLRKERSNLSFYRSFDLPDEIKSDNVEAEMKDGVLTITMAKENPSPTYESKKVNVK